MGDEWGERPRFILNDFNSKKVTNERGGRDCDGEMENEWTIYILLFYNVLMIWGLHNRIRTKKMCGKYEK
jgi:hypothetical protein